MRHARKPLKEVQERHDAAMANQRIIPTCETHGINLQWRKGLGWKCPRCLAERYADTRPVVHNDFEEATNQVLKDMAVEDALDEMGW